MYIYIYIYIYMYIYIYIYIYIHIYTYQNQKPKTRRVGLNIKEKNKFLQFFAYISVVLHNLLQCTVCVTLILILYRELRRQ